MYPPPITSTPHSQPPARVVYIFTDFIFSLSIHTFLFIHLNLLPSLQYPPSVLETLSLDSYNTSSPIFLVLDLLPQLKSPPTYPYFDKSQSYLQHQRFLWVPFRQHYLKVLQASLAQGRPPKTWSFSYIP